MILEKKNSDMTNLIVILAIINLLKLKFNFLCMKKTSILRAWALNTSMLSLL